MVKRFIAEGNVPELGFISTCPTRLIRYHRSQYFLSSCSNDSYPPALLNSNNNALPTHPPSSGLGLYPHNPTW